MFPQVPSAEARELWKGFIHSVCEVCDVKLINRAPSGRAGFLRAHITADHWNKLILLVSCQLSVPSSLNLLPGQIHMLKEAVEQEKERLKVPPPSTAAAGCSPYVSLELDMPG